MRPMRDMHTRMRCRLHICFDLTTMSDRIEALDRRYVGPRYYLIDRGYLPLGSMAIRIRQIASTIFTLITSPVFFLQEGKTRRNVRSAFRPLLPRSQRSQDARRNINSKVNETGRSLYLLKIESINKILGQTYRAIVLI